MIIFLTFLILFFLNIYFISISINYFKRIRFNSNFKNNLSEIILEMENF
jgi:hypothetical protein